MHSIKSTILSTVLICAFTCTAHAQDFDPEPYLGENWYGMYMNGAKIGYSVSNVTVRDDGRIEATEDSAFKINMAGIKQNISFESLRIYGKDGALNEIISSSEDISGTNKFHGIVKGDTLTLTTTVGGKSTTKTFPKPSETLQDMEMIITMLTDNPTIGDTASFAYFDPMYAKEITGTITLLAEEEKVFDGVLTKVYKTKSIFPDLDIESTGYMAQDGTTLEENLFSGSITMRLEPKEIAQDVTYANDTIVSNAAIVKKPIKKARTREELTLHITGPFTDNLLLTDANQSFTKKDDGYIFTGKKLSLDGVDAPDVPITEASVAQWIKATTFVQSDDPKLIAQAKKIIGDKKDSAEISEALSNWVYKNMDATFSARLSNSLEVLDSMEGDCTEHSMLFIGLARAAGLPAREVAGLIYAPGPKPGFYFHQWAKVWVGQWIEVDPTFNQPIADATHIRLVEGDLFEQAKLLPVIGKLKIQVVE